MCGREPGGARAAELGVCPAATASEYDGVNHGRAAGRYCWAVAGTLCRGRLQGNWESKRKNCLACPFMAEVTRQEDRGFVLLLRQDLDPPA